jgi:hypothetical protein
MSHVTPHTSHLTPHTSHLAPHTSHLTPHTSHLTPHTCPGHGRSVTGVWEMGVCVEVHQEVFAQLSNTRIFRAPQHNPNVADFNTKPLVIHHVSTACQGWGEGAVMAPPVANGGRLSDTPSPDNSKKAAHKKQQQQPQQQRRDLQSRSGLNTGGSAASAHVRLPLVLV